MMASAHDRVRCPTCGLLPPHLANFGLDPEGTFDPASARAHETGLVRAFFGGRGKIWYEEHLLPFAFAVGLRNSLAFALERLDEEIAAARSSTVG